MALWYLKQKKTSQPIIIKINASSVKKVKGFQTEHFQKQSRHLRWLMICRIIAKLCSTITIDLIVVASTYLLLDVGISLEAIAFELQKWKHLTQYHCHVNSLRLLILFKLNIFLNKRTETELMFRFVAHGWRSAKVSGVGRTTWCIPLIHNNQSQPGTSVLSHGGSCAGEWSQKIYSLRN